MSHKIDQSCVLLGRKLPVNGITEGFSYGLVQAPKKEWGTLLQTSVIMAVGGNILDLSHPFSFQLKELS